MAPQAVLFDLDGTLWNSHPWYAGLLEAETGVAKDWVIAELASGESIVALMRQCGANRKGVVRRAEQEIAKLPLYPSAIRVLEELRERGVPLGIFTSLPGTIAEPLLHAKRLYALFGAIVHAGNCPARKPSPRGVIQALQAIRIEPSASVVYVGGRDNDSQAASAAGVSFAWAAYGYGVDAPPFVTMRLTRLADVLEL